VIPPGGELSVVADEVPFVSESIARSFQLGVKALIWVNAQA
jgi:hypothetical protein